MGFGLDSIDNDFDKNSNILSVLRTEDYINNKQVSYNITYKLASDDPADAGKIDQKNSYI